MAAKQEKFDAAITCFKEALDAQDQRLIVNEGNVWIYANGFWRIYDEAKDTWLEKTLKESADGGGVTYATEHAGLWRTLRTALSRADVKFDQRTLLAAPNGTIDLADDPPTLMQHDPEHYTTRAIAIPYNPKAKCPAWEAAVARMVESPARTTEERLEVARYLQQWMGVNIIGPKAKLNRHMQKGLLVVGPRGSGKSSFSDVVVRLYGNANIAAPRMSSLGKEFGLECLLNAQAIVSNDGMDSTSKMDAATLKALVTSDEITVPRKFQKAVTFRYTGGILFTANSTPKIVDDTDAVYDRLTLVRMDRVFTASEAVEHFPPTGKPIKYFEKAGELPGILNWALRGGVDAIDAKDLNVPACLVRDGQEWRKANDPTYGFMQECVTADQSKFVTMKAAVAVMIEFAEREYHMKMPGKVANAKIKGALGVDYPKAKLEGSSDSRILGLSFTATGNELFLTAKERGTQGANRIKEAQGRAA